MLSLAQTIKDLKNSIVTAHTTVTNNTFLNRIKNRITESIGTNSTTGEIYNVVKDAAFTNLPPKIGYLDEKTVPMYAAYNMSNMAVTDLPCWITSDLEGREITYFRASQDGAHGLQIYRAFRNNLTDTKGYTVENQPLAITINGSKIKFVRVFGISNDYIVLQAEGGRLYHFSTFYSSNTDNWQLIRDVTDLTSYGTLMDVLWFDSVKRYLVVYQTGQGMVYLVANEALKEVYRDTVFDFTQFHHSGKPTWTYHYGTYGNTASAAYVPDKNKLVTLFRMDANIRDNGYTIYNADAAHHPLYCNTISNFTPDKLLTNHYFASAQWDVPLVTYYDAAKWDWLGDGTVKMVTGLTSRGTEYCQYDSLNKMFYYTHGVRDWAGVYIKRIAIDDLASRAGTRFLDDNAGQGWNWQTPDTSPWAKQTYAPSVMYDSIVLRSQSNKYGGGGAWNNIAIIPEATADPNVLSVRAGSWLIGDGNITNVEWAAGYGRYSCAKENFNTKDGVSWYQLLDENGYYNVYRLECKSRKDQVGSTWNDNVYRPSTPVARFKKPNISIVGGGTAFGSWFFRGASFGGGNKLIIYGRTSSNYKCSKNGAGKYVPDDIGCIPAMLVISEDGSYKRVSMPQNIIDWYTAEASDRWPYVRNPADVNRTAFLDSDGRTVYYNTHEFYHGNGDYCFMGWKAVLSADLNSVEACDSVGAGDGTWCGIEVLGWNKRFGYYRTCTRNRTGALIATSPTSALNAINRAGDCKTYTINNNGSVGLIAYIQATPIYLGGYYSVLPATEVYLKANSDNYIYLSRDKLDYQKINVENYDHLLGAQNNDMGINFSRILISKITTDNKGATSQEYFNIDYYGASKS